MTLHRQTRKQDAPVCRHQYLTAVLPNAVDEGHRGAQN